LGVVTDLAAAMEPLLNRARAWCQGGNPGNDNPYQIGQDVRGLLDTVGAFLATPEAGLDAISKL
jgi:hypothetical protein